MKIGVAATAALVAILPLSASPSKQPEPPRLVSSSVHGDSAITIPLIAPHYPASAADQATAMFNDVNAEREKRGLPALERDDALDRFAYAKAIEMAARGYFGHTDPNGFTFQDRLRTWRWPVHSQRSLCMNHYRTSPGDPHQARELATHALTVARERGCNSITVRRP